MAEDREPTAGDQLVELLVYAPIGLAYEYREVLPKLIARGRSQVQIARVVSQMAAGRMRSSAGSSGGASGPVGDLLTLGSVVAAKAITDLGSQVGLAPPDTAKADKTGSAARRPPSGDASERSGRGRNGSAGSSTEAAPAGPLPIAGYDTLSAKEIVPLLDDLSATQRARVRTHEEQNRSRKTILAKLDSLGA
ncbi:MAG: hypothetical protein AAF467_02840 [Actinomycetota bacterium]